MLPEIPQPTQYSILQLIRLSFYSLGYELLQYTVRNCLCYLSMILCSCFQNLSLFCKFVTARSSRALLTTFLQASVSCVGTRFRSLLLGSRWLSGCGLGHRGLLLLWFLLWPFRWSFYKCFLVICVCFLQWRARSRDTNWVLSTSWTSHD